MTALSAQALALPDVQLGLLGDFSLVIDAEPTTLPMNAQRLICYLALKKGSLLRQHVAGSLWGSNTERHAGGSLRSALWRLGHPIYPLVEIVGAHLRLSPDVAVDVRRSEALARRVLDDSIELSESDLDDELLSSDLLPDWTEDWVIVERQYHSQLRLRALEALCRRLRVMGRFGQAVQAGTLAVACEPLRESSQRALVEAHLAEGNYAAALRQYNSFRELLLDELKLEPSLEMTKLVSGFIH